MWEELTRRDCFSRLVPTQFCGSVPMPTPAEAARTTDSKLREKLNEKYSESKRIEQLLARLKQIQEQVQVPSVN